MTFENKLAENGADNWIFENMLFITLLIVVVKQGGPDQRPAVSK